MYATLITGCNFCIRSKEERLYPALKQKEGRFSIYLDKIPECISWTLASPLCSFSLRYLEADSYKI